MRKFTYVLIFMMIGVVSYAQQYVVNPLWDHSVAGSAEYEEGIPIGGEKPTWMGALTERGMALYEGKLYIPTRSDSTIVVLDAATGEQLESIKIDTVTVKGGTYSFNDIVITPSGKIILGNLATDTHAHPFKVYMMEADEEGVYTTTTLLEWQSEATVDEEEVLPYRLGDGIAVYGDVGEGENGYILVGDANAAAEVPVVFKWNIENGEVNAEPETIVLQEVFPAVVEGNFPRLGISPRLQPLDEDRFWADGHATFPTLYNMEGELLSTFNGEFAPMQAGISGVYFFTFQDQDFILAPTTNHVPPADTPPALFQLFSIPEAGAEEADSIAVFPEHGLGGNTNGSYAAPMAVDVQEDSVILYIMSPDNGVAAYSLKTGDDEPGGEQTVWNISDEQFNALGALTETTEVDGLTIYAAEDKVVEVDENNKEIGEWSFTHRLKLGGAGTFDEETDEALSRVVAFDVPGNSKISIALQSSSSGEDRVLNVGYNGGDSILTQLTALGAEISLQEYEYTGDAATLNLFSPSSGVNIYLIVVEPLTVSSPVVGVSPRDFNVYPNPAVREVFVDVDKPVRVAIYNTSGMLVKSKLVESKHDPIMVNDLVPGMYIIRSQMTNDFSKKLIITK